MASEDYEGVWIALPREGFVRAVKRVMPALMPDAGAVTNMTVRMFEEHANFEMRLRYGAVSEKVATHVSLPIAIAVLGQYGHHAVLYRFEDEALGAVTLRVAFEADAVGEVVEFVNRCVDAGEEIVGAANIGQEG
jgi:hypothetical protein